MKFKFNVKSFGPLNEVGQANPIRWTILRKDNPLEFTTLSQVMKCTDYFNDVVAYNHSGKEFSVYGFTNNIKLQDGGLYVLAQHVQKETFLHNLTLINDRLKKDLGCWVQVLEDDEPTQVVLFFPKEVMQTTYRVSTLLYLLRIGNYGVKAESWDSFFDPKWNKEPAAKGPTFMTQAKTRGFKVPEAYSKFWYFSGAAWNSEANPTATGTLIHNCGCSTWWAYMPQAATKEA